ncbi:MAG: SWIM zinc finger family protein [Dehalococcoidia bacterium]
MHSSLIGKIEKAKRYAEERDRAYFTQFAATFRGDHNSYEIGYDGGTWLCSCLFFSSHGVCSHIMALQRILEGMVARTAVTP